MEKLGSFRFGVNLWDLRLGQPRVRIARHCHVIRSGPAYTLARLSRKNPARVTLNSRARSMARLLGAETEQTIGNACHHRFLQDLVACAAAYHQHAARERQPALSSPSRRACRGVMAADVFADGDRVAVLVEERGGVKAAGRRRRRAAPRAFAPATRRARCVETRTSSSIGATPSSRSESSCARPQTPQALLDREMPLEAREIAGRRAGGELSMVTML